MSTSDMPKAHVGRVFFSRFLLLYLQQKVDSIINFSTREAQFGQSQKRKAVLFKTKNCGLHEVSHFTSMHLCAEALSNRQSNAVVTLKVQLA